MRIIGICRFSYPAEGGFKRMHDSTSERESYLYAPERMELRFRHFETLTLPSIAAQSDSDFTFLVMIGKTLPQLYLDRLHALCDPIPQVRIVTKAPVKHRLAMQEVIKAELGEDKDWSLQFRLDDDDAVGLDFIRLSRKFVKRTADLRGTRWGSMAYEFNSGYSVRLSEHGINAEEVISPFWACGLAVLFRPGSRKTVMNYAHHKLHHQIPTLVYPNVPMYLRAVHEDNDSAAAKQTGRLSPLTEDQVDEFKRLFNVDDAHVRRVFSAPAAPHGKA